MTRSNELILPQMETVLLNQPGQELSFMTELEYLRAADEALPLSSDRLQRRHYREAAAYDGHDGMPAETVPLLKLARILCCRETRFRLDLSKAISPDVFLPGFLTNQALNMCRFTFIVHFCLPDGIIASNIVCTLQFIQILETHVYTIRTDLSVISRPVTFQL